MAYAWLVLFGLVALLSTIILIFRQFTGGPDRESSTDNPPRRTNWNSRCELNALATNDSD